VEASLLTDVRAALSGAGLEPVNGAAGPDPVPVVMLANHVVHPRSASVLLGRDTPHLPIVFSDEAQPQPLAVLGLRERQNLFVDDHGRWLAGTYVPAYVRRHPFIFLEDAGRDTLTLCIDEAAPQLVADGTGQALFDEAGAPTAVTRNALDFCRDYQAHHRLTRTFVDALVAADVLVDHRAEVTLAAGGAPLALQGFKVVDEPAVVAALRRDAWEGPTRCAAR
jgi:hypothetical protein